MSTNIEQITRLELEGDLAFATVIEKYKRLKAQIIEAETNTIQLSLNKVAYSDSAGLALIIELLRIAKRYNKDLTIKEIPDQLQALFKFCGLKNLLALYKESTNDRK